MKIRDVERRFDELNALIVDPAVMRGDPAYPRYLKEHGALARTIEIARRFRSVERELADARALLDDDDPDIRRLAAEDVERLEDRALSLRRSLILKLSLDNADAARSVIMEIRPGAGGEEAALFVSDLLKMYQRYAASRKWKSELASATPSDRGGFKEVIATFSGDDVYPRLRFEGGTHRVQRVPLTESQGRIHTSTATVAVMPEADEVDVAIRPEDLEISAMHSRGPGGQSVNTACSAVRVVHKPSGLVVHCEIERSQYQNKMTAMRLLRSRLMEMEKNRRREQENAARRSQTGAGERSEKIRTYNFPQARVTDHRLAGEYKNYNLERVLEGDLDPIIEALSEQDALELFDAADGDLAE
ncbi:MAG TPA: peptide chain release factor 1 [Planctomycetes bacterium]|nr:peptide chain release factor 1 [Planctomycetota bacterium]